MNIEMQPVVSSNVAAIGYDADSLTLRVQFNNGSTYDYAGVPPQTFEAFQNSDSKGRFLNMVIKSQFSYAQVG